MTDILQINWRYDKVKFPHRAASSSVHKTNHEDKYSLRACSVKKRTEIREKSAARKRGPKPKAHSAKMSKYRRKTANARERLRMGEINTAFDQLKEKIPLPALGGVNNKIQKCEKLTKINILHIAINYIRALEDILETGEMEASIYPERLVRNPFIVEEEGREEEERMEERMEEGMEGTELERGRNSSPDSGIQEDGEGGEGVQGGEEDDEEEEFPDWTELSSTLDLRSAPATGPLGSTPAPGSLGSTPAPSSLGFASAPSSQRSVPVLSFLKPTPAPVCMFSQPPSPSINTKLLLLTAPKPVSPPFPSSSILLLQKAANPRTERGIRGNEKMRETVERTRHSVTLTSRSSEASAGHSEQWKLPGELVVKQTKNTDLLVPPPAAMLPLEGSLCDFLSDFETFEPIPDLDFTYEDPFRIM